MPNSTKPNVMVLFGGVSSEHQISCATAAGVLAAIDHEKWNVVPVGITPQGKWVLAPDDPGRYSIQDGQGYTLPEEGPRVTIASGTAEILVAGDGGEYASAQKIDVALPLLHGPFGEDGALQGLFEISGIKYVGCGVDASAVCMDKHLTKVVLSQAGIPVGKWELVTASQWRGDQGAVLERLGRLGLPVFVKPCRAGSSIGITRVDDRYDLVEAIEAAAQHDPRVIVEAAVSGREVECGILQLPDGELKAGALGEIVVTGADFYDYQSKYFAQDAVSLQCPAELSPEMTQTLQDAARRAFEALGGEGLSRVDFFCDPETGSYLVNEVNTLPGFTPFSMYPTMMRQIGFDYPALIDALLLQAIGRPAGLR